MYIKIKTKGEFLALERLIEMSDNLTASVKTLTSHHMKKLDINKRIFKGISEKGMDYATELEIQKKAFIGIIEIQEKEVDEIVAVIDKVKNNIKLLVYMEQATLAIHANMRNDDLSGLIDVINIPLENFRDELGHINMLKSSFKILRVELGRQKSYIENLSMTSKGVDEKYLYQGQRFKLRISEEEIISVVQLRDLCIDLEKMLKNRMSHKYRLSDADIAAYDMMHELGNLTLKKIFVFRYSLESLLKKAIAKKARTHYEKKLLIFTVFFLFSRLKKFDPARYRSAVRAALLSYSVLGLEKKKDKRDIFITAAIAMSKLSELSGKDMKPPIKEPRFSNELSIINCYQSSVAEMMLETMPFVDNLIDPKLNKKDFRPQEGDPDYEWIIDSRKHMELIFKFDAILYEHGFEKAGIGHKKKELMKEMGNRFKISKEILNHLFENWQILIPIEFRDEPDDSENKKENK